jgi:hypothetical protein
VVLHVVSQYLRLILFSVGLLIGMQLPAVVDQYSKRVNAHLLEAEQSLGGFQQTADAYFSGSIERLVSHYQSSDDKVFQNDAANIQFIFERVQSLNSEMMLLEQSAFFRTFHVMFAYDQKLMNETMQHYSYALLLNPQALIWGISIAFCLAFFTELLLRLLLQFITRRRRLAQ